jgi:AGCS family alanine or glycine:cation symporter
MGSGSKRENFLHFLFLALPLIAFLVLSVHPRAVAALEDDGQQANVAVNDSAASSSVISWDEQVNESLSGFAKAFSDIIFYKVEVAGIEVTLVIVWLVIAAVFFTLYFRFINLTGMWHGVQLALGKDNDEDAPGEITHFQALCTALSGTVGIGNIGAIAFAIAIGGPGALFWLIIAGFLGMTTKFAECTLGVKYRQSNADGTFSGGPMYYLNRGLADREFPALGKFLGGFYAAGLVFGCLGAGNMFQSNQAYSQFVVVTGGADSYFADRGWLFGIILAFVLGMVIIGGIKSIAKVTSKLVPLMAVLYCSCAVIVLLMNAQHILGAIAWVFRESMGTEQVSGGMVGIMMIGFQRALFSNEAGLGTASIAHAAVKTRYPVTEGLVATVGPFLDTIVICTLTSLCIITSMLAVDDFIGTVSSDGSNLAVGIDLTSAAFERNIPWSPYLIAVAGVLFALSTMISWSYYGTRAWCYLVGEGKIRIFVFNAIFCCFSALGCMLKLGAVIDISDALIWLIAVPNIIGLYILCSDLKSDLRDYLAMVRQGRADKK